jgi:hypothetical protein
MNDKLQIMESIINTAIKKITVKKRRENLLNKVDQQMDDRQRKLGVEPYSERGKPISWYERKEILDKDERYRQLNARYSPLSYPDLYRPSNYLTGKKKK